MSEVDVAGRPTSTEPDAPERVVVLGGTGAIGSAVTATLAARPVHLRVVGRNPAARPVGVVADVDIRASDMTDADALVGVVHDAHVVVHAMAAGRPGSYTDVMTGLVEYAAGRPAGTGLPTVVFASTITQVGVPPHLVLDGGEADHPATDLARDQHEAERSLLEADAAGVLRAVSLRLPTVYGCSPASGRFDRGVITAMIRRAIAGEPLTMWHDGTVERDLLHVADAASALVAAVDHADGLAGRHWLAGTGVATRLGDAFATIAGLVSERTGADAVPVVSVEPPHPISATDTAGVVADPRPFHRWTGWRAAIDVSAGLAATVDAALADVDT